MRHTLGSRFYVHSNNNTPPNERRKGSSSALVVVCHGYYENGAGTTSPRGVENCAFLCDHGRTNSPDDLEEALGLLINEPNGNGGFWHNPTNAAQKVLDYTLTKELDGESKSNFKGKASYQFIDTSYINSIYTNDAPFDIVGLHNTWRSGRTLRLSTLFETLFVNCPGVYTNLYCAFCREEKE